MKPILIAAVLLIHGPTPLPAQSNSSVSGLVVGMDGTPAAGIQVRATAEGPSGAALPNAVTETDATGQYRFENIPPGTYMIKAGPDGGSVTSVRAGLQMRIAFDDILFLSSARSVDRTVRRATFSPILLGPARVTVPDSANTAVNIAVFTSAVMVKGRLAIPSRMTLPTQLKATLTKTVSPVTAEGDVHPDGSFEFPLVPPGSYILRLNPNLGVSPVTIDVADQNLNGIELGGRSAGVTVSGNLPPSDRPLFLEMFPQWVYLVRPEAVNVQTPVTGVPIGVAGPSDLEARLPAPQLSGADAVGAQIEIPLAAVGPQGRFEFLAIPPGVYSIRTLPDMGLANTTITVADTDVADIRVGTGVRVRGSVIASNFGTRPPELINITASGLNGRSVSAGVAADGTFEFSKVGPGTYRVLIDGKTRPTPSEITVADEEIIVRVEAPFKPWVIGRVLFASVSPPPDGLADIHVALSNGFNSTIKPDGTFRLESNEGEYEFFVRNLPEGYFVRSVYHGAEDLLNGPMKVDASILPREILVTVEFKPGTPQ